MRRGTCPPSSTSTSAEPLAPNDQKVHELQSDKSAGCQLAVLITVNDLVTGIKTKQAQEGKQQDRKVAAAHGSHTGRQLSSKGVK
ncbi:MAG: hypothetical protein AAFZ15_00225 [Bacteroidota bacterium]